MYILNGTDPEGDPIRYGLTFEKGTKEYFRVDAKSGNVTLIQELDREVRRSQVSDGCLFVTSSPQIEFHPDFLWGFFSFFVEPG